MAHNARIRADLAAWTAHVPVDPAEFEALDQAQFESINGDDGGTWNPAAFIGIGGAGFQFSGTAHRIAGEIASTHGGATPNFTLDGANGIINIDTGGELHVAGNGALQAYMVTLQSGACAQFNGTVGLHAKLDLLGYTDVVWENHSTAAIKSGAQVNVESGGAITMAGGSTLTLSGTNSLTTPMACSGTGHVKHRTYEVTSDADENVYIADGDFIWMGTSTISAARTWILSTSGAANGDTITLYNRSSTYAIHASIGGATYDLQSGASGRRTSITAEYFASQWRAIGEFILP